MLTGEACEVIFTLPGLRTLSAVIQRDTPLPSVVLPNLIDLKLTYDHDGDWLRVFRGAVLGPLESVTFHSGAEKIGGFLEAFEKAALATSIQHTLSEFCVYPYCSWNPNYSSLHSFTQMTDLIIEFFCDDSCSSTVDDDIIINLARTMPKLETLELGCRPCHEIPTGVTVKGLVALAHHCPDLSSLRIHFQVASLGSPPAGYGVTLDGESVVPRRDCALRHLEVGEIPVSDESVPMVALTLVHIFPNIAGVDCYDQNWISVLDAICLARGITGLSCKEHPLSAPRSNFSDISPGATLENGG